jgi:hypothetical protein
LLVHRPEAVLDLGKGQVRRLGVASFMLGVPANAFGAHTAK